MIAADFRAMGTTVTVRSRSEANIDATRHLFEHVEQTCSRFRSDSELSVINRTPGTTVALSPMMHQVMQAAAFALHSTEGLVNVSLGGAVADWGYDRTFEHVEDFDAEPVTIATPEWHLEGNELVRAAGVQIDLGGIAKGWTCDLAVERGLASAVSAGGDIRSADPETRVAIQDPWGNTVTTVMLGEGALATSSVTRRQWNVGGQAAHHLIDPRSLSPSISPVLSASAVASTALEAEAAAKAVLLLGADGLRWAERQPWISDAVVIWNDGNAYATTGLELAA
jgi:thiamine biosynthesis lipoprotein